MFDGIVEFSLNLLVSKWSDLRVPGFDMNRYTLSLLQFCPQRWQRFCSICIPFIEMLINFFFYADKIRGSEPTFPKCQYCNRSQVPSKHLRGFVSELISFIWFIMNTVFVYVRFIISFFTSRHKIKRWLTLIKKEKLAKRKNKIATHTKDSNRNSTRWFTHT